MRFLFFILVTSFFCQCFAAEKAVEVSSDTLKKDFQRYAALPVLGYSEETELQFGAMGMLFFKPTYLGGKTSEVDVAAYGTTRGQFVLLNDDFLYLFHDRMKAEINLRYENWSNRYFGIGNDPDFEEYAISNRETIGLNALVKMKFGLPSFAQNFMYGVLVEAKAFDVNFDDYEGPLNLPDEFEGNVMGLGYHLSYDSRDNINWPTHGFFGQWNHKFYNDAIGDFDFTFQELDIRGYTYLFWKTSMAVAALWQRAQGNVPFNMLAGPDGIKRFRGVESLYFRDEQALIVQAEFRKQLFWRLAGNIFFEGGKSGPYFSQLLKNEWHKSVGFGGQLALNRSEKLYARGDLSWVDFHHVGLTVYIREAF